MRKNSTKSSNDRRKRRLFYTRAGALYNMITAIVTAAGNGSRSGLKYNKLLFRLPNGKTVLESSITPFLFDERITEIIVTSSEENLSVFGEITKNMQKPVKLVVGGETRSKSVRAAVAAASGNIVLIHDGARPFLTQKSVYKCINDVLEFGTSVLSSPCVNTVGIVENGLIVSSGKKGKCEIQTPQCFYKDKLLSAFEKAEADDECPDESSLYCKYVGPVRITESDERNLKLTRPDDFALLYPARVGNGYDLHVLIPGRKLILGGTEIPHDKGLLGHSDADALIHAIIDAMFSAAGLRDIGYYFSDKDPAYEGISSVILLEKATEMIREKGFVVYNLSAVIMAEKPKLNPFVPSMKKTVARVLGISEDNIGITCTTSEKVGFIGREEGIAVSAICSLMPANAL